MVRSPLVALLCALLPLAASAGGPPPDWREVADEDVVNVVTRDEDGATRDTKVWLVVVDGQGYIRTGGTAWGDNVARDPELVLRIGDREYALRAEFVEEEALRERIVAAFREKYGFQDALVDVVRGSHPRIMRLVAR